MREIKLLLLVILVITDLTRRAMADTDYHCLNLCVQNGHSSATCMPQCSYAPATSSGNVLQTAKPNNYIANHRILSPLEPNDPTNVISTAKPANPYHESRDYSCIATCLQNKMQYETCVGTCTTITTANGTVVTSTTEKSYKSDAVTRFQQHEGMVDQPVGTIAQ